MLVGWPGGVWHLGLCPTGQGGTTHANSTVTLPRPLSCDKLFVFFLYQLQSLASGFRVLLSSSYVLILQSIPILLYDLSFCPRGSHVERQLDGTLVKQ